MELWWSCRPGASIARSKLDLTLIFLSRAVRVGIDVWKTFRELTAAGLNAFPIGPAARVPQAALFPQHSEEHRSALRAAIRLEERRPRRAARARAAQSADHPLRPPARGGKRFKDNADGQSRHGAHASIQPQKLVAEAR